MTKRLDQSQLNYLPPDFQAPGYDRDAIGAGIVHLGVGAFHRAHQAFYTEKALQKSAGNWGIIGASLRSANVAEQLNPQNGLYTLVEREGEQLNYRIIGSIKSILVAPEDPEVLISQLASSEIRIVTLTITEKGYFYAAGRGGLNAENPSIIQDSANYPNNPVTAIGYLAAALKQRKDTDAGGVTLLSCDNLPHNGRVLQTVLRDFIQRVDASLLAWVDSNVTFPCSMVDRIVPASTEYDLELLAKKLGCNDLGAVFTEPFSQWVVEENFANGAPDWESAGALYTQDVTPFETMKLRLLNGSHSLMAYLGYLAGYDYVHEVMGDQRLKQLVRQFMDTQAQPTLTIPSGFDVDDYKEQLCLRFANSALNHKLYQIAQDGSQKIPQRWLQAARELSEADQPTKIIALAIAAWIRFLEGQRESGDTYVVDDPLSDSLQAILKRHSGEPFDKVVGVLSVSEVFGDLVERTPEFVDEVTAQYSNLVKNGITETVSSLQ